MRRRDHPSFPSAITCCFLSLLKTLLMPSEPIRALSGVNVPGFPMAGFQPTLYGRIRVTPEVEVPTPEPTSSPRCRYCKIGTKVLSRASQKETEREPPIYGHGFSSKQYRSPTSQFNVINVQVKGSFDSLCRDVLKGPRRIGFKLRAFNGDQKTPEHPRKPSLKIMLFLLLLAYASVLRCP